MQTSDYLTTKDGTDIWYGTVGSGPPLILCDGFACDGFIWPYIIDHFYEHFTIVRWHYRGHGRSSTPTDLYRLSMQNICEDLCEVLDTLEIESAVLAGHSMGAQVLLQFWEDYPERIDALIPICGTFKRPLDTFNNTDLLARLLPYMEHAASMAPQVLQTVWETIVSSQAAFFFSFLTELNSKLVHGEDFRPYLEHTANMDIRVYLGMLHHLAEHDAEHVLSTVDVPSLVIASEFDSFTPIDRSEAMAQMLPNSDLVVLPGASHAGPIELPDTVIGAMEKFFLRHDFMTL